MNRFIVAMTALICLFASFTAHGMHCEGVKEDQNLSDLGNCRIIKANELVNTYCIQPEGFNIASLTDSAGSEWATNKTIILDKEGRGQYGTAPSPCELNISDVFRNKDLDIQISGSGSAMSYSAVVLGQKADLKAIRGARNDILWLQSTSPVNYKTKTGDHKLYLYFFLRDARMAAGDLAKFVYAEALDAGDSICMSNAPAMGTTVVEGACGPKMKIAIKSPELRLYETGVGGGGEGN